MFANIKTGTKLMGTFLVVVILMAATALIGLTNMKSIADRSNVMYKKNTIAIDEMGTVMTNLEKMRGDIYRYIAVPADRQVMAESINNIMTSTSASVKKYRSGNIGAEEKKIIANFDIAWLDMQRGYRAVMDAADRGHHQTITNLLSADSYVYTARVKTFAAIDSLNQINRKKAALFNQANNKSALSASGVVLVTTVFTIVVAVILALNLVWTLSFVKPLSQESVVRQEAGKGYLSQRQRMQNDEIGIIVNTMDQYSDNLQKNY